MVQRNPHMLENDMYRRSTILDTLNCILEMRDKIKIISDMAFDAVDQDGNGSLDLVELGIVLRDVAKQMRLNPPTDNDIVAVLGELDQDNDNHVSKDEFEYLIIKVLEKMAESELEIENNANRGLYQQKMKEAAGIVEGQGNSSQRVSNLGSIAPDATKHTGK